MRKPHETPPKPAADLMAGLLKNPDFLARHGQKILENRENYRRVAGPILRDLAEVGLDVESIGDLRHAGARYETAVPILIKWLPSITDQAVREDMIRTLSMPKAATLAVPVFLNEFRRTDIEQSEGMRWAIANGLEILAGDAVFDRLVELATDPQYGRSREMLVLALGNCRNSNAAEVLIPLLEDDQVVGHAAMALRKLKPRAARPFLEKVLDHPKKWVRTEARKAIAAIDRANA